MPRAPREKKQKKTDKGKLTAKQTSDSSQSASASLPTTTPNTPGSKQSPLGLYPLQRQDLPKVAIPRLHRDSETLEGRASGNSEPNRIAHACEACRHRKTKCSGVRPTCQHCQDFKLECVYVDGKRDRARKEYDALAERLEGYEKLLNDIGASVDGETKRRIADALHGGASSASEEPPRTYIGSRGGRLPRNKNLDETSGAVSADFFSERGGSSESIDEDSEDSDGNAELRESGEDEGFTEKVLPRRVRRRTELGTEPMEEQERNDQLDGEPSSSSTARPGSKQRDALRSTFHLTSKSMSSSTYYCDDLPLLINNDRVNKYEMPPREVADLLLQCYFDTVQPSFPIICRMNFVAEYQNFFSHSTAATDGWIAVLNLIFAIGAKYAYLVGAEWAGQEGDHLIYFTRARLLGFTGDSILSLASIQHVQICGLISFFLMSIHHINRSWTFSGLAIRHAATLGLNLCHSSIDINDFDKEMRCRMWWALCSLERRLALMTGRTPSYSDADSDCPQPFPIDEDSIINSQSFKLASAERFGTDDTKPSTPSSTHSYSIPPLIDGETRVPHRVGPIEKYSPSNGLYFLHLTVLSSFTNKLLSRLYRVANRNKNWTGTLSTMADLTVGLESWREDLPLAFDFTQGVQDQQWIYQRNALGFHYHSMILIINRPCLCRTDRQIPLKSSEAERINHATAAKCVRAAIDMLNLVPNEPDPASIYNQSPWWSLVHYLAEAAVVCMLELSFRADHMPQEVDEIFHSADKAVQQLWSMASGDLAASRAWRMCDEMLWKVAPKVGKSAADMMSQQHELPTPMQEFPQAFYAQAPAFRPGRQTDRDSAPLHSPDFTSYDEMNTQDPFLQSLDQASTTDDYQNMYTMTGDGEAPMGYSNLPDDGFFFDPNLEQQQQQHWYQDDEGGPSG